MGVREVGRTGWRCGWMVRLRSGGLGRRLRGGHMRYGAASIVEDGGL